MRVLVTGSTGFIGSHLTEKLCGEGFEVTALARKSWVETTPVWLRNSDIVFGDVTDTSALRQAVKGADVVFHLASLLGRWQSEFDDAEYYRVNVGGTKLLASECQRQGVEHFIYLSSAGVMGRLTRVPADESAPLSPGFPYERSKCFAESVLKKSFLNNDFPVTVIRPTHIYGPRDKNTVKVFRTIKRLGVFPLIGGGAALFQPLYIDDLVKGLILCLKAPQRSIGKTYLVAGKQLLTYRDFMVASAKILDVSLRTFVISERLSKTLADVTEKLFTSFSIEPPLTRSRVEFFSRNQAYKIEKIRREIGFSPETEIETGLRKTIAWCQQNELL
jgi:dihydroflavonol-4-reductase